MTAENVEALEVECGKLIDMQQESASGSVVGFEAACLALEECYLKNWNLWKGRYRTLDAKIKNYQTR